MMFALGVLSANAWAQKLVRHDVFEMRLSPSERQPNLAEFAGFRNREALVYVRITVDAKGRVTSAQTIDGFFSPELGINAQVVARKLKFLPKTVDGKSVESTGLIPIRFTLPDDGQGSNAVNSLQTVFDLLTARKWSDALEKMDQMVKDEIIRIWDYHVVETLRAAAYEGIGDAEEGLRHALRGAYCRFTGDGDIHPSCVGPALLIKRTVLLKMRFQRQLGRYGDALQSWAELQRLESPDGLRSLTKEVEQLRALASGDDAVATWLQLDADGDAQTNLFRDTLTFNEVVDGAVEEATIVCPAVDAKPGHIVSYVLTVAAAAGTVPADANKCSIRFKGKPATRIRVIQSGAAKPW